MSIRSPPPKRSAKDQQPCKHTTVAAADSALPGAGASHAPPSSASPLPRAAARPRAPQLAWIQSVPGSCVAVCGVGLEQCCPMGASMQRATPAPLGCGAAATHLVPPHRRELLLLQDLHQPLLQHLAHQHLQDRLHFQVKVEEVACEAETHKRLGGGFVAAARGQPRQQSAPCFQGAPCSIWVAASSPLFLGTKGGVGGLSRNSSVCVMQSTSGAVSASSSR